MDMEIYGPITKSFWRQLNKESDSKSASGFLIDQQQQKYILTTAGVKKAEDKLKELDPIQNQNATQRKEAREYRDDLQKHHERMSFLTAASGKAIALIHLPAM